MPQLLPFFFLWWKLYIVCKYWLHAWKPWRAVISKDLYKWWNSKELYWCETEDPNLIDEDLGSISLKKRKAQTQKCVICPCTWAAVMPVNRFFLPWAHRDGLHRKQGRAARQIHLLNVVTPNLGAHSISWPWVRQGFSRALLRAASESIWSGHDISDALWFYLEHTSALQAAEARCHTSARRGRTINRAGWAATGSFFWFSLEEAEIQSAEEMMHSTGTSNSSSLQTVNVFHFACT